MSINAGLSRSVGNLCRVATSNEAVPHLVDWLKKVSPSKRAVVCFPKNTREIANLLTWCNTNSVPVVPQGGNTGLVQASVPHAHEEAVVVSLKEMTRLSIDPSSNTATCEAGVVLQTAQEAASDAGLVFPLDMGSRGSATVGGATATNAGGIHVVRYGSFRSNVLGMEVVTPYGSIIDEMTVLRKDNTGYDLKQLFVGCEGTLGIVTKVNVALHPAPSSTISVQVGLSSMEEVHACFEAVRAAVGPCLGAFEVMDHQGLQAAGYGTSDDATLASKAFAVLVDVQVFGGEQRRDEVEAGLFAAVERWADSTMVATSGKHARDMWHVRESLPVQLARLGPIFKFDLSFDQKHFYVPVEETRVALRDIDPSGSVIVTGYGHYGDGNVHLNVVDTTGGIHRDRIVGPLTDQIYRLAHEHNGSISAEHGVGREKREVFSKTLSHAAGGAMHRLKRAFDPNHIMNPNAVIPLKWT